MNMENKICSAEEAVSRIKDGATITVSSSSGLGCPDFTLAALGRRFAEKKSPKSITTIHPIAAGDMYGIKGIEHLAQPGLLSRVIAGSYPSGPSSLPMPEIWRMISENEIPAYNVPSGILFDMHRESARKGPGLLTQVGMGTYVEQEGCAMNDKARAAPILNKTRFNDEDWLFFPSISPDVAIIRATTADTHGNLSYEQEGALLGALDQAIATRNNGGLVLAQVKRIAKRNGNKPIQVPGHLVDLIIVDPHQKQTTQTDYDPSISGEVFTPWELIDAEMPYSVEKIIARRAALELHQGAVANLGFGISAMVPYILVEEGFPQAVTWVIEQGAVGGLPLTDFAFGCAANPDAIVPSPSQFNFFQGGGFDMAFLSFLEVDSAGNVNVSKLAKRPYLTAGCGGFVDITVNARKLVFSGLFSAGAELALDGTGVKVKKAGKFTKFVKQVEQVSFCGARAIENKREVIYITERCVMKLEPQGLVITEIAPGIELQKDILSQLEAQVEVAEPLVEMPKSIWSKKDTIGLQLGMRPK